MEVGMIGLGRMGLNMALRLAQGKHRVVGWNRSKDPVQKLVEAGGEGAATFEELASKLKAPRVVWIMLPAGPLVDDTIDKLMLILKPGDLIVEGGNSNYKDSMRRAGELQARNIHFLDAGVSGGIWGLKIGYCQMIGGSNEAFKMAEPLFKTLAPANGYLHAGPAGAGHFCKMVHNGIEYGMMQAYAEGFEVLENSPFDYDLARVAKLWNQGSVVRSWLLELAQSAFEKDPGLKAITGYVEDSGEGRWTVQQAIEQGTPAPVIALSLFARFASRQPNSFGNRMLAALRHEFGGHAVQTAPVE
ncbi:MAG: decarboxylating 6-phosphogluconate dehydrogenase [Verrucomicrobiae bacterium]|nr:decarboxylating 6-phosphogluconate dehydrogenase [Verrucomicrobiae bacterium]